MPHTRPTADAALALVTINSQLEEFSKGCVVSNAILTAVRAINTENDQYGLVRLEQARDAVAVLAAALARQVIDLDTAIKGIQAASAPAKPETGE